MMLHEHSTCLSISGVPFVTENYDDSLSDARIATDLQPCYVTAIERGEISVTWKKIIFGSLSVLCKPCNFNPLSPAKKCIFSSVFPIHFVWN